jgi:hypothetical protein
LDEEFENCVKGRLEEQFLIAKAEMDENISKGKIKRKLIKRLNSNYNVTH